MSSRFVSGGAINTASGESSETALTSNSRHVMSGAEARHKHDWEAVERELQQDRQKRAEARAAANKDGERSLYDVLQANKAAKQAAFEESHRLKNQFRPLDEDDIDFLDGLAASSRAEEDRVKRETQEGLDQFRQAQERQGRLARSGLESARDENETGTSPTAGLEDDISGLVDDADVDGKGWHVSAGTSNRKRKRREDKTGASKQTRRKPFLSNSKDEGGKETEKRASTANADKGKAQDSKEDDPNTTPNRVVSPVTLIGSLPTGGRAAERGLLVDYGSDVGNSDDD